MTSFCLRFHSCSMLSDSLYTHVLRTNCELTLNQVFSFHSSDRISELLILIDSKTVQTMSKNITRIYVFYVRKICFFASAKHFICFIYRGLPFKILNLQKYSPLDFFHQGPPYIHCQYCTIFIIYKTHLWSSKLNMSLTYVCIFFSIILSDVMFSIMSIFFFENAFYFCILNTAI